MKPNSGHATIQAIWQIWAGVGAGITKDGVDFGGIPIGCRACDSEEDRRAIGGDAIFSEIPTCPRCAVLYDEAMTAREELLGRREAA